MVVVIGTTLYVLCSAFFLSYFIGCLKVGEEEVQLWLGEKILNAWRFIRRREE